MAGWRIKFFKYQMQRHVSELPARTVRAGAFPASFPVYRHKTCISGVARRAMSGVEGFIQVACKARKCLAEPCGEQKGTK
jgi:hypothetical protein